MEHAATIARLAQLLDASARPIYAVDASRRIVYGNAPLAAWLGLDLQQIVGRSVEYHSESITTTNRPREAASPLTDLCPPPRALSGEACSGAVGCVGRDGRLVHRRAEFVPLAPSEATISNGSAAQATNAGVLVFLAADDMRPEEISAELTDESTGDELHRAIRRFRRKQSAEYAVETLLGSSPAMQKVRAQVAAAASSRASVVIRGRRGSGRAHIARAIHYHTTDAGALLPIDCGPISQESVRKILESARDAGGKNATTVMLQNLELLPAEIQPLLRAELSNPSPHTRFIATVSDGDAAPTRGESDGPATASPALVALLSTITIEVPPLVERIGDLPILAQCFLEAANRGAARQVGSLRPDALDQLALYAWPGELDELRSVIKSAHDACGSHEITPADLPPVIHHAAKAAALPKRFVEKIVLEDLLAEIEREIVTRALAQAGGNKSAAADLLGMTRPRLYRRLVQLGLASESSESTEADGQ